jgi:hypothetical protein
LPLLSLDLSGPLFLGTNTALLLLLIESALFFLSTPLLVLGEARFGLLGDFV